MIASSSYSPFHKLNLCRFQLADDQRQYELALNDRDATLRRMREECQQLVAELQGMHQLLAFH